MQHDHQTISSSVVVELVSPRSALPSPKNLYDSTTRPKWTANDIDNRQAEMAKQALNVWRL
jgi:hypothetical protein